MPAGACARAGPEGTLERDLPFYDPVISESSVAMMNGFAQAIGLLDTPVAYEDVVATRFRELWTM